MDYAAKIAASLGKGLANLALNRHPEPNTHALDTDLEFSAKTSKFLRVIEREEFGLEELRKLSWSGIPAPLRQVTWLTLLGILPLQRSKRSGLLDKRRKEYSCFVGQYHHNQDDSDLTPVMRQIKEQIAKDVPRTNPGPLLFQHTRIQQVSHLPSHPLLIV